MIVEDVIGPEVHIEFYCGNLYKNMQFEDVEGNIEQDQASLFAGRKESE
jgi:hypothetical protein